MLCDNLSGKQQLIVMPYRALTDLISININPDGVLEGKTESQVYEQLEALTYMFSTLPNELRFIP